MKPLKEMRQAINELHTAIAIKDRDRMPLIRIKVTAVEDAFNRLSTEIRRQRHPWWIRIFYRPISLKVHRTVLSRWRAEHV